MDVQPLYAFTLMRRMAPEVRARLGELWEMLGITPDSTPGALPLKTINARDANTLFEAGIIVRASELPTTGWVIPFSVVETKETGQRTRFIAWPKQKNAADEYEADVPLGHASRHLEAVWSEGASTLDLRAPFYQVPLPQENARAAFRFKLADGTLVELCRLPMGCGASPEIMQILTSVLAGASGVATPRTVAPASLRVDV
ncbi:hypothetical protein NESM_000123800 [Novymonas esmeraldas]|uniref:Transposase n=1 Tax=Novymonas esmeraldas TaxID=1808958 RepID=A0AAW0F286_9TRYP